MRWEFFLLSTEQSYTYQYCTIIIILQIQAIENVFCVCIASYKHERVLGKKLRIFPTLRVFISGYAYTIKKFSIAFQFYEIPFQRKESKTLLKEKFLPTRLKLVLYMKFCAHNQFLLCKKRCFPKYRFFWLKMLTYAKTLTQHVCKDFPSLNKQKNGYNSKLFEFSIQYLFKIFCF